MNTLGMHIARINVVRMAPGLLVGCVPLAHVDGIPTPTSIPDKILNLDFSQYVFDPSEYPSGEVPAGTSPLATLPEVGKTVTVRQIGKIYCKIEPVPFERQEGGIALRVMYEFVEPNSDGLCDTVAAYFGTDLSLDKELSTVLRKVILVGPFRTASEVSIDPG